MQSHISTIFAASNDPPKQNGTRQKKDPQRPVALPRNVPQKDNFEEQKNDFNSRKKIRQTVLEYLIKYLPKEDKMLDYDPKLLEESYQEGLKEAFRENLKVKGRDPVEEARKEYIKKEEHDKHEFNELLASRSLVLFRAVAVFPFDLFPDEIIVELNKVNIICREFFLSENRHSIPIKNIQDVIVESALFFATVKIVSVPFVENTVSIKYLHQKDAMKAQRIIDGLMIAIKEGIELTHLEHKDLVKKIEEIGRIQQVPA